MSVAPFAAHDRESIGSSSSTSWRRSVLTPAWSRQPRPSNRC